MGADSGVAAGAAGGPSGGWDGVPKRARRALEEAGVVGLWAAQRALLEPAAAGKDALVRAPTGAGKTLAYLLPAAAAVAAAHADEAARLELRVRVLVLAPTRELAAQVHDWALKVLKPCPWLVAGSITGGERAKSEKSRLRKGKVLQRKHR